MGAWQRLIQQEGRLSGSRRASRRRWHGGPCCPDRRPSGDERHGQRHGDHADPPPVSLAFAPVITTAFSRHQVPSQLWLDPLGTTTRACGIPCSGRIADRAEEGVAERRCDCAALMHSGREGRIGAGKHGQVDLADRTRSRTRPPSPAGLGWAGEWSSGASRAAGLDPGPAEPVRADRGYRRLAQRRQETVGRPCQNDRFREVRSGRPPVKLRIRWRFSDRFLWRS